MFSTADFNTALSVVKGHWVKLSPEKITIAMRSVKRLSIKSCATFLAASILFGVKSCAVILPLTSTQSTISTPSPSACCSSDFVCGLANAAIMKAIHNSLNKKGKCLIELFQELNPAKLLAEETLRPAWLAEFFFAYQTIITGSNKPSKKN